MIWFIIAIALVIFIGVDVLIYPDLGDWICMFFVTVFIGMVALGIFAISSELTSEVAEIEYQCAETTEIVALKDSMTVKGGYYVFGGYTNSDLQYYYAEKNNGGYHVSHVSARNTVIMYTDENPRLEHYKAEKFKNKFAYVFGFPMDERYILYVPEGSLTTDFVIDLQ